MMSGSCAYNNGAAEAKCTCGSKKGTDPSRVTDVCKLPQDLVHHASEVLSCTSVKADNRAQAANNVKDKISIIMDTDEATTQSEGMQMVWVQPQALTLNGGLTEGCMLYQCDDNTYKLSYSNTPATSGNDKNPENGNSSSGSFTCQVTGCGRQFSTMGYLKLHQLVHTCSKTLTCTYQGCNRQFVWPSHLKYHQLTHAGNRPYRCEEPGCGKAFYTGQRLAVHKRRHTGEKPFVCKSEGCNKSFATAGNLKNHARIHTGEKPYVCEEEGCGKGFTELSSLKKHKLVHTGQKPFQCQICSQTFTQSGSRNAHMRNAHSQTTTVQQVSTPVSADTVAHPIDETSGYIVVADTVEEIQYAEGQTDIILDVSQPSTSANVVVLTEPEEMVAITTGFRNDQTSTQEEIVYQCDLLRSGITTEENCPQAQS